MKDQLQQELLKKLKPGVKPSDLKKHSQNQAKEKKIIPTYSDQGMPTPPPTLPLKPTKEGDLPPLMEINTGEVRERDKSPVKNQDKTLIKQLRESVNYWRQTAQNYLKRLQTFEAELDNTHEENQALKQTIQKLKQNSQETTDKIHLSKDKTFTCSTCQQEWSPEFIRLIDKQNHKYCPECVESMLNQASQETGKSIQLATEEKQPKPKTQICRFCRQAKPTNQLKPRHIKNLPHQDPKEITLICQECLTYRAIKADYYCPRTSKGRDTYEGNEFDCYCPTERRTY